MSRVLLCFLVALCTAGAQEYDHRVSAGFGGFSAVSGPGLTGFASSPGLTFDYGWRFSRYGQFDMGVDTVFSSSDGTRHNLYVPRAGYRIVVPFLRDRMEAHMGFGGAYMFYKPTIAENEMWLVYGQTGVNYALDRARHYRAGFTIRWMRDPIGRPWQQWVPWIFDASYSWGR